VGHELPILGSDLAQEQQWRESLDSSCREADLEPGCLRLDVKVFRDGEQGRVAISNPGPNYSNDEYSECLVTSMNPLSPDDGGPETVPAGSTIAVQVVCTPAESEETTPPSGTGG
jgi:hypothetical protein